MISLRNITRLLSLPVLWMGIVQLSFGALSLFFFRDNVGKAFMIPSLILIILSLMFLYRFKKAGQNDFSYRDALMFATLTWIVTGILGGLPIMLVTKISFTDAVFESLSALTTTGATVLTGLDELPKSFLMYRQFLQWMGGLGVVIFVVAVLPMLNVGGMRLLKAETPGPVKDEKLSPRIANTAHYLWFVYVLLTVLCALSYYFGGMTPYDAIAHSFTTISTGGFSTHDASMWFYESHLLLGLSNVFMLLGAISFALHFRILHSKSPVLYWKDEETRVFICLVAGLSLILAIILIMGDRYGVFESFSFAIFHVISFITSTGFGAADLSSWPAQTSFFLVFCAYLGGCAGSTAGGNKIIRDIITFKVIRRELLQCLHPKAILPIRFQRNAIDERVSHAVMAFMTIAAGSSLLFTLLLMATGLDFWSAFTAVAACINVLGPGFGEVGSNFIPVSDTGIWLLNAAMILGRLEYFTILAMLTPTFWRY
ncbi:trk system potassium uptake protein TrkH [Pseudoalteromonas lipolytica]|uniref:Trk system potassium uptake protein n=2 Tax=Pseudoalteromonas lipolytica TaxID=570156 RepID=A0ABY1GPD1_9GAMM|nr:trk system potassium uptake protein TrkH [Pseudoalteromonas lipolytica LMEB 39]SFT99743.1 trk system potassium uptake protein TrkH [Pseudoalteromonas lipolytica]